MIEKSKYLGGDASHTHLVKGLDFALLQKVRQEITQKDKEELEQKRKVFTIFYLKRLLCCRCSTS